MNDLRKIREARGLSQREAAKRAGVSFRTIQLIESGGWDPKISTLQKVLVSLGYPEGVIESRLKHLTAQNPDSVPIFTGSLRTGEESWKILLFNFVDRFRAARDRTLIDEPPAPTAPPEIRALTASTVESLCREQGMTPPDWCLGVAPLKTPWFPSGIENLKASALVESPAEFRRRNIFVLGNFLERA